MIDRTELWIVIVALGLGSFGLRFVFLGLVGDRPLPEWLTRHLRYTAVAVLPALVMPLVVWPSATEGETDPVRLTAAGVTLAAAYFIKNVILSMLLGGLVLAGGAYWFG
ncbi:AzlD domain-containing protein [Salipiger abyssi]|uniref:Putative membrane protein n=1 Tax=Salipiger abyssi TaxID=1250539 RepID=A0A1P8UTU0_9RHOB|nr:AzlD domain-containing protein [Salipiger abyssi]APZ52834.1 putative membrane protein [Salipiger abyssi]